MAEINTIAEDRLVGIAAVAEFRGEPVRRTRYLVERGLLPVGREGRNYIASKRTLIAHWHRLTAAPEAA